MAKKSSDEKKQIGARIRDIRIKKGMSQQQLAEAAGLSLPHVSVIELGKSEMKLSTFMCIAEALQISTDALLRPDIPEVNSIYQTEFQDILGDCTPSEIETIIAIVRQIKSSLHKSSEQ